MKFNPASAVRRPALLLVILLLLVLAAPVAHAQDPTPGIPSTATATVTAGKQAQSQLIIQGTSINVRGGPGTIYPTIGTATKGQQYLVTGRDQASKWWLIDYKGRPGWVAASLVKADAAASQVPIALPAPVKGSATPAPEVAASAAPALPPYQDAVTLNDKTAYPVRATSVSGWGYEFVDESKDFDVLVNRDIFGAFLHQLWPELFKRHPKGLRITFKDAEPGVDYTRRGDGFGDGESAYVTAPRCATEHEEHNTTWQNELVTCEVTLVSPGPGLTDITVTATVLGYGGTKEGNLYSPVFDREPFSHLGAATRAIESGQWHWSNPFLQVVSLRPVAAPAPQITAASKGPLPPPTGHIAFTRLRDVNGPTPAGISDIALLDVKTGEVRVVAQNGRQPDMRNDGRIVFNGEGGGRDDLQVVNQDGSNLWAISTHPEDSAPDWSAGNSIAFHSALAGPDRIFVQWNGDQRSEPQYLEVDNSSNLGPFTGRYPVWVGGRIAYTGCDEWQRRSVCGIYIFDPGSLLKTKKAASSGMLSLTRNPQDRPTDMLGNTVLFSSPQTGNWDVYAVSASGGKARQLTSDASQDLGGTYSPDGNYIAFMSNRGGWSIWIMEADGANPRQLAAVPEGFGKLWDQDRLSWGP